MNNARLQNAFQPPYQKEKRPSAFTLIEVLVAVAILTVVVSLVSSITNSASTTIAASSKRFDADLEGRAVLDRLSIDIAKMIKRKDIEYLFEKTSTASGNGNDAIGFYSEAQGYGVDTSPYSVVEYKVLMGNLDAIKESGMEGLVLGRSANGLAWDTGLNYSTSGNFPVALNYQIAGGSVFRLEYTFLMKKVNNQPAKYTDNPFLGNPPAQHIMEIDSIVVGVAVMDAEGRQKMSDRNSASDWAALVSTFPDAHGNSDIVSRWYPVVNSALGGVGGIPAESVKGIRVYQRSFPLTGR